MIAFIAEVSNEVSKNVIKSKLHRITGLNTVSQWWCKSLQPPLSNGELVTVNFPVGQRVTDQHSGTWYGEPVTFLHETARHFISLIPFIFSSICSFFTSTSKYFSCSWYSICTHCKWTRRKVAGKENRKWDFSICILPAAGQCGEIWR